MTSSRSPLDVLLTAHQLGEATLPTYASKFSRKTFTLPQLFACLALRQFYNLSYRRVEALLADCPTWREAIGMTGTPDHNTLCDAFAKLTEQAILGEMFDRVAVGFEKAELLKLDEKPLAIDSTAYESHHVSRHYEKRKAKTKATQEDESPRQLRRSATRSDTVKALPKLALAVAASCHLILAAWATTGLGSDHRHFEPVLLDAWRRAQVKSVVADAGYDSEKNHRLARCDMGLDCLIPPTIGRPKLDPGKPPAGVFRAEMAGLFAEASSPGNYGQRWQVETVNSMMKRNYGSALRAAKPASREREMLLKALTHNIAL